MHPKTCQFDPKIILNQPLMLHLATVAKEEPRSSPVWFLYEEDKIWLFGMQSDSFIKRLGEEPRCVLSIVDFDLKQGILLHVGVRGVAKLHPVDQDKLTRFVSKYLGMDSSAWNAWFVHNVIEPLDVMVAIDIRSIVAKDVSFFKTGPNLASDL